MIVALFHLFLVALVVFCLISYVICGYAAFIQGDRRIEKLNIGIRVIIWLVSPLLIIDVLIEYLFGWSFMS